MWIELLSERRESAAERLAQGSKALDPWAFRTRVQDSQGFCLSTSTTAFSAATGKEVDTRGPPSPLNPSFLRSPSSRTRSPRV